MVTIESPFPAHAWPRVWTWMESFRSRVADDYAPQELEVFVRQQLARSDEFTWGVWRDGELGGLISYVPANPITGTTHCLFKRSFWGRETTQTALRLAYDEIFKAGVLKITSYAFEDNHAIRALGLSVGGKEVALLKCATMRGGVPVAVRLFELFREDFYASTRAVSHGRDVARRGDAEQEQTAEHNDADLHAGSDLDAGGPVFVAQAADDGRRG